MSGNSRCTGTARSKARCSFVLPRNLILHIPVIRGNEYWGCHSPRFLCVCIIFTSTKWDKAEDTCAAQAKGPAELHLGHNKAPWPNLQKGTNPKNYGQLLLLQSREEQEACLSDGLAPQTQSQNSSWKGMHVPKGVNPSLDKSSRGAGPPEVPSLEL